MICETIDIYECCIERCMKCDFTYHPDYNRIDIMIEKLDEIHEQMKNITLLDLHINLLIDNIKNTKVK